MLRRVAGTYVVREKPGSEWSALSSVNSNAWTQETTLSTPVRSHTAARKALYMPGLVAKHHNPVIAAMAKRLQSRGMAPKAIIGASMRRLVHLIYGVINSGRSFDMGIPMRSLAFQDGI